MGSILALVAAVISAYLVGSFPTSFILAKTLKGVDIRQVGSKNAGATNVLRTVGKIPALITLIVDIFKGVLVVTVVANFFYRFEQYLDYEFYRALLALTVVCGHMWPVFLRFKGGKGIATTLGIMAVLTPKAFVVSLGAWLIVFFITNYVSLASIVLVISIPIFSAVFNKSFSIILLTSIICILTTYKHKENIKRLLKGEESKTILFSKSRIS